MKCDTCGISVEEITLHRTAPKGQSTTWRCRNCFDEKDKPELDPICNILEEDNFKKKLKKFGL